MVRKKGCVQPPPPPPPRLLYPKKSLSSILFVWGRGGWGSAVCKTCNRPWTDRKALEPPPFTCREWKKHWLTWLSRVLQTPWSSCAVVLGDAPLYRHATSPQMERCVMKWRTEKDLGWGLSNPRWRPGEQFQRDFWGLLLDQFLQEDEGFFLPGRL